MADRIAITGIGVVSALGLNVEENLAALKNKQRGIKSIRFLETIHQNELPAGEIAHSDEELASKLGFKLNDNWTRTSLLGLMAAREAWEQARMPEEKSSRLGIVSATTVAGMRKSEDFYSDFLKEGEGVNFIQTHDAGDSTERIADDLHIHDYLSTISTACSSSANAIMIGARLLKNDRLDKVLVGGTDSLSRFTINGFNTLMILDKEPCRSFDENRAGLNLGEGAAYLILERESEVGDKPILAFVEGYANANDAYHQTASSPEGKGAALAMSEALKNAGLEARAIDYINAHGTATGNNDLSEGMAIQEVFGNRLPKISSTKPYTGHTLGASGAIEAVFSVLTIREKMIFPNLNFKTPMKELNFSPETKLIENVNVNYVLSNSFGFGGNNSTLIIAKK
jgi:3-oxoacyl-[acyl-carrier-protein] synthase-1